MVANHVTPTRKVMNTLHVLFLVVSTILWIISGGLIYQMWHYMECANAGIPDSFGEFKSQVEGGLSLCHEIKTIEILAWVIAAVSVVAAGFVVRKWMRNKKRESHQGEKGAGRSGTNGHV
jgi:hypothetical protein